MLHIPMQFLAMILPLIYHPFIIMIFCRNSDLFVKVFNEMYDHDNNEDVHKTNRRFRQLPVQEQLVTGMGLLFAECVIFYFVMILIMNDMSHLLINMEQLQFLKSSVIAILLTTLLEIWSASMWAPKGGFLSQFNCLVLSKVESTLNKLLRDLTSRYGAISY